MTRRIIATVALLALVGCEALGFDDDGWALSFVQPVDGQTLDAGATMDVIIQGVSLASEPVNLCSARLKGTLLGAAPSDLPPLEGEADGGAYAIFRGLTFPAGDLQLTASATDLDRSTVLSSIVVHGR